MSTSKLRNIAIIAHVDHGKTTLVDQLLRQSGTLDLRKVAAERVMDSNPLERERGITILAKNTALRWGDYRINIVDTPGHADFGGEVERVLSMVDCVLLLVDAVDGPMPQTRFVTQKAFSHGLRPIVVINKIDREEARPHWVLDQTFDLFDKLGASEQQLDFPVVYGSALRGFAGLDPQHLAGDMTPLFEVIVQHCPPPQVDENGPLQLQVSQLDYSSYVGAIGIGRIKRGRLRRNSPVAVVDRDGKVRNERIMQVLGFLGLERIEVEEASAGDIVAFAGIERPQISDTICDPACPEALPPLVVDEPTISMTFEVNNSPFCGRDGKYVTSRQIRERLMREVMHNVALRVEDTDDPDKFRVFGRGEMHLGVLLENMRREGYELGVSRPRAVVKSIDGVVSEPFETLAVDLDESSQGAVMQALGERGGQLTGMHPDGKGRVRLDYVIPSRGLIGFQTDFRTLTSGTGLMHHIFDHFGPLLDKEIGQRGNGVLISNAQGKALAYSLFSLQERGKLMVSHGDEVYEGQIVGIHSRDNDLVVNPLKGKKLTNIRAAGKDEALILVTPIRYTLEQAMEFIADDELVEITPNNIRLRKRLLKEHERKRAGGRMAEESVG
ncbi:GTP-binding protein TypA [Steroidobacter denitrificans]|uniref:Large ribosomal subunit assembly factor BipA n=1 Tax=Steroidobacter denitrificans TaxID=465721 RepID=A0A127FAH6_STEDE|nr:translational GTPase TypA [Steroidobacter denitrificans]AMN47423.1 GTP-binding protein TypA [Steroidobacter denitrificans]